MKSCNSIIALLASLRLGVVALMLGIGMLAHAELSNEQVGLSKLPTSTNYRIYVSDPAMGHVLDGRIHVIDGDRMRYLGLIGTGYAGSTVLSPDRKDLYVATTYHSRLARGIRTDVVEVYSSADLTFEYEIEIPTKHAQALMIKALLAVTADGKFLLVQNATPATSITVVDLNLRKVAAEIATPGCWGIIPWKGQANQFSMVCGDGTLATIALGDDGKPISKKISSAFFDPDTDPIYMHYEQIDNHLIFISYNGTVHDLEMDAQGIRFAPTWSLVNAVDKKSGWKPGGYELFSIRPQGNRLYVGMHDKAREGSHKMPAKEIWSFDMQTHSRIARSQGYTAISMTIAKVDNPRLFLLDGVNNVLRSFDIRDDGKLKSPMAEFKAPGETPIYLEMH